ncbi:MAG: zinc-ribbon domain-containing protein [Methanobacteriaceae archaeon]
MENKPKVQEGEFKKKPKFCRNCGETLEADITTCEKCGTVVSTTETEEVEEIEKESENPVIVPNNEVDSEEKSISNSEKNSESGKETKFCSNCGAEIDAKAEICPKCGVRASGISENQKKEPILSTVLSFLIPGIGQIYNGQTVKGLILLVGYVMGIFLFFIPGIIVWAYGIYDAHKTAKRINNGEYVGDWLRN